MYNKNTNSDLLNSAVVAGLGAGTVTSFAVSQGQSPILAIIITAIAVGFVVVCKRFGLV